MLFRKRKPFFQGDFPPNCEYCGHQRPAPDEPETYYCNKKGVVCAGYHFKFYEYDPQKRVPKRRPPAPKISPEECELKFS